MRKLDSEWGDISLEQEKSQPSLPNFKRLKKTKAREGILRKKGVSKMGEIVIGTPITEVEERNGPGKRPLQLSENLNQNL